MRNVLPLVTAGCFVLVIFGLIVGGATILLVGGKDYLDRVIDQSASTTLAEPKKKKNPAPVAEVQPKKESRTLLEARQGFKSQRAGSTFVRNLDPPERVPDATLIRFPTSGGELTAYLSNEPKGKEKRAAVVWAHGGFGGISRADWEQAKPFHAAGFVVMVPSFRGENSNAGNFEMFYGEVDDLLAAVDFLAKLPYVDADRIYVAGHSSGGTLTLLAAATGTTKVRAFFSIAGLPNTEEFLQVTQGAGYQEASPPFDPRQTNEAYLRSALPFVGAIKQPTFYFGVRVDKLYAEQAEEMERRAMLIHAPFRKAIFARANHFNIVEPVINLLCAKIAADKNGIISSIAFEPKELTALFPK